MPLKADIRRAKIKKFITFLKENKEDIAIQELDEIFEEITEEQQNYVQKSELRELIIEVREGFKTMDKRFQDLIHYTDKRFEEQLNYINKRFDEQLHYINKRFEEQLQYMNKRFEAIDKRFEDTNKRIHFIQWLIVVLVSILFSTMTYFNNKNFDILQKILETNQQIQQELKNRK
jgi:exonuclease VII large subunit